MRPLQLKLQNKLELPLLPRTLSAFSPSKPTFHFAIPPSPSTTFPKLCFPSLPFIKSTSPVGFRVTPSRPLPRMAKNSDMMSQFELQKPEPGWKPEKRVTGIFLILLLNLGIYFADHVFQVHWTKALYLYHYRPAWYQFATAAFCHSDWSHLSSNLFFLYIFGKLVEEEEGFFAVWLSYLLTGVGANLVSWLILPRNTVSLGASGAVFGLFAISVLVKMSWDWRKILEVLILGQFVIERVMEAAQASARLVGGSPGSSGLQHINHLAHLSGALVGVVLIWLLSAIPSAVEDKDTSGIKKS